MTRPVTKMWVESKSSDEGRRNRGAWDGVKLKNYFNFDVKIEASDVISS